MALSWKRYSTQDLRDEVKRLDKYEGLVRAGDIVRGPHDQSFSELADAMRKELERRGGAGRLRFARALYSGGAAKLPASTKDAS